MKRKNYHTVGIVLKFNGKWHKEGKSIPLANIYMTTHFPGFGTDTSINKEAGLNLFYEPKPPLFVKRIKMIFHDNMH